MPRDYREDKDLHSQALVEETPFEYGEYRFVPDGVPKDLGGYVERVDLYRKRLKIMSVENEHEEGDYSQPIPKYTRMWLAFPASAFRYCHPKEFTELDWRSGVTIAALSPNPFIDITGDGTPDVVIIAWTGCMHGGYHYYVYSLGGEPKKYDTLDGMLGDFEFADIDGDGKYEAIGIDGSFAYWCASGADSPEPGVILRPGPGGYQLATNLMTLPPARKEQLQKMADECREALADHTEAYESERAERKFDFVLDSVLWTKMLNLIYSGNSKQAWTLLDLVWLDRQTCTGLYHGDDYCKTATKEQFRKEFLKKLSSSPYWKGLLELNPGDEILASAKKP